MGRSDVSYLRMDAAPTAPKRRARAGWAWLAGGDGFVLATVPSEVSFLNGLGMWVAGMAVVSGFAMTVAASQWWSTSIVSVALGAAALGRPLLPDRAARPEELRHELGLEPRDHDSAPRALARDRARRRAADEPGDLQRLDQRPAQQDDDGPHPPGDERDHARSTTRRSQRRRRRSRRCSARRRTSSSRSRTARSSPSARPAWRSCSQTHKLGCGPYCKRDARRAAAAAAALKSARPQFAATIAADRRKIALWQAAETAQVANRVADDQGRPRLPRPPGGARAGREGEPGRQEVRRVLPRVPDRDRPRRARAQAHASPQHRRRLRAKRRGACGRWTSSRRTAWRSAQPSSRAGSRSRRGPRRTRTSSGFAATFRAGVPGSADRRLPDRSETDLRPSRRRRAARRRGRRHPRGAGRRRRGRGPGSSSTRSRSASAGTHRPGSGRSRPRARPRARRPARA